MSKDSKANDGLLFSQIQRRVIAGLLFDGTETHRVMEIVGTGDFHEPKYELIYQSISNIARRDETVSAVNIAYELESEGNLAKVGGPAELYLMRDEGRRYLEEATVDVYARVLKESSVKAKVTRTLDEFSDTFKIDSGVAAAAGISDLQSGLNEELYRLSDDATSVDMVGAVDDYLKLLDERARIAEENKDLADGLQGIPSLLPSLNKYTGGWTPGQLVTVGARTGIGKSVFAINAAVAAAQSNKSTLFFSLEMGRSELMDRVYASITGIPLNKFKNGSLDEDEKALFLEMKPELDALPVKIETAAEMTIDSIRAACLRQAQSEAGLDLVIIDYLQLVTPSGEFRDRQVAVAHISRNAKLMAKQLGVPVMVLVQVNRESKDEESTVPKLYQIRESGAIAQDSDVVILLHREETLDDTIPHTLVLLEKNRGGEANKVIRCHSNLECSLFREIVKAKDVVRVKELEQESMVDDFDLGEFDDEEFGDGFDDDFDGGY